MITVHRPGIGDIELTEEEHAAMVADYALDAERERRMFEPTE